MYKNILLVLIFFPHILLAQLNQTDSKKLVATCKVWGFLKYYHPKVANGEFNWNEQLFKVLPKIEEAKSNEEFSLVLETWINSLGEIKEIAPIVSPKNIEYFDKNFDLSWIDKNKLFSKKLSQKLRFIEMNRFQGNQHYVGLLNAENIFVKNEDYSQITFMDKNQRLLGLFAYWNLIEYFFPYKYLMDKKWDDSLIEMLPLFMEANNENDFYNALRKLTVKLNDTHVIFSNPVGKEKYYLPIVCKIIDGKMIVTEILDNSLIDVYGFKKGDIITKVNDKTIDDKILEYRDLICASNEISYLNKIIEPILSGPLDQMKLEILVDGVTTVKLIEMINFTSNRYMLKNESKIKIKKEKFKIIENNIGYVDMGTIKVKNIPDMIAMLKHTKAIIFDMRNYPNGTYEDISNFLNNKEKTFAIYTKPVLNYPGRFRWAEGTSCGTENKENYKGKVVVLLNEESMSQSEWTAMCFQTAENTTIIGSQTAGADGNVSEIVYMKAILTRFSGIGVYYPDKRETQRIGIIPDIEIKPTIKGIQQGKDEVLDRAIKYIETGK
jgi:C-terminal processing protease CtpA/Prc